MSFRTEFPESSYSKKLIARMFCSTWNNSAVPSPRKGRPESLRRRAASQFARSHFHHANGRMDRIERCESSRPAGSLRIGVGAMAGSALEHDLNGTVEFPEYIPPNHQPHSPRAVLLVGPSGWSSLPKPGAIIGEIMPDDILRCTMARHHPLVPAWPAFPESCCGGPEPRP